MDISVSVVDLSTTQKKLHVEIPATKVQKEIERKYRDLSQQVRIKGFRPGKVPRTILKSYYGKTVENEVSSQFIQETFPDALRQADLKPLVEADVSETRFEDSGAFMYEAVVDVCPSFSVDGYKGLPLNRPAVLITDEQVQTELERIRQQHAQVRSLDIERPVRDGDVVIIDVTPMVDGEVFQEGVMTGSMLEIGQRLIHPEFDTQFVGHNSGESFSFELDFPEDSPRRDLAGKRVQFDVVIKELKEKILPALDDDLAKEVAKLETLEGLKQAIRDQLAKRDEERITIDVHKQIVDQLLEKVTFELSDKVVEREVDRMVEMLQRQFQSQGLKIDTSRLNSPEIRAEYRSQAENTVRQNLILQQVAHQEGLDLTPDEEEEIYQQVARLLRTDVGRVRDEYAQSVIVQESKENRLAEKVFKFIEEAAVVETTPGESSPSAQE